MKEIIPATITNCRNGNQYSVHIVDQGDHYYAYYETDLHNAKGLVGKRRYDIQFPKYLELSGEFFETMGLLQGEMSKTRREQISFCNSEAAILKRVTEWFIVCMMTPAADWRWYIKVNLPKTHVTDDMKHTLSTFWIDTIGIHPDNHLPTIISGVETTKNTALANKGTLVIEKSSPLYSQTLQSLVSSMTTSMPSRLKEHIIPFMRGVIAAEACVNYRIETGHRRVFITATNNGERQIFRICLEILGIPTYDCHKISDIVISGRENLMKLQELGLMTLHPEKHARFEEMMASYTGTWHERRQKSSSIL